MQMLQWKACSHDAMHNVHTARGGTTLSKGTYCRGKEGELTNESHGAYAQCLKVIALQAAN